MKIAAVTRTTEKSGATKEYFNGGAQSIETRESERNNFLLIKDGNNFEYLGSYTRTNLTIESVDYYVYTLTKPTTISGFKQTFA